MTQGQLKDTITQGTIGLSYKSKNSDPNEVMFLDQLVEQDVIQQKVFSLYIDDHEKKSLERFIDRSHFKLGGWDPMFIAKYKNYADLIPGEEETKFFWEKISEDSYNC